MKRITVVTAGTRGSVQSVLALSLGLREAGFAVKMCAGKNLEKYITENGIPYEELDDELLHLAPANEYKERAKSSLPLVEATRLGAHVLRRFRPAVNKMVRSAWESCRNADAIVYRPHGTGGYLLAQRLGVPSFLVEPAPMITPTAEFPHLLFPKRNLGRRYNRLTYRVFDLMIAPLHRSLARAARRLEGTPGAPRNRSHPTVLNNFSPHVLPRPTDWPEWARVTGWLFAPPPRSWQPPADLMRFLEAGPAPLYVGFGSMVRDARKTTETVLEALRASGSRFVLATGWGGLAPEDVPSNVFVIRSVPHDWLFPKVAAVIHHGGAGTVGNGLRAGKPTLGCPFFGDQCFWSDVVHDIGVGPRPIPQHELTSERLLEGIRALTRDESMRERALRLGEKLRREDGVKTSIEIIQEQLAERPRSAAVHATRR